VDHFKGMKRQKVLSLYGILRPQLDQTPSLIQEKLLFVHTNLESLCRHRLQWMSIKMGFFAGLGIIVTGLLAIGPVVLATRVFDVQSSYFLCWFSGVWGGAVILIVLNSKWILSILTKWKDEIQKISHMLELHRRESTLIHQNLWERGAAG
jgi:hypothetical protein